MSLMTTSSTKRAAPELAAGSEDDIGSRLDCRRQFTTTVTIDPATARDFDDAITLSRDDRGFWSLGVHIADVSHFVHARLRKLDHTARRRGTSVYLPGRVIPMLPAGDFEAVWRAFRPAASATLRERLLEFNAEEIRTGRSFARSAIRVDHRFSYEEAMAVMKDPEAEHAGVAAEVARMLGRMLELAMVLRRRRFQRGALELSMPEIEIDLGDQGQVVGAHLAVNDQSHQVIEEFMLAANEAVASYLTESHAGFLRRAHADPDPAKLHEFADFARSLGIEIELPQSRFELQRVLNETTGKPVQHAIHYGLLRSLKQAVYTPETEGHFALASDDYCHFTSPIRRYPDLQVHRQLTTLLEGKKPKSHHDELVVLAEHCNRTEPAAEGGRRELIQDEAPDMPRDPHRRGQPFPAVVIGVEDFEFLLPAGGPAGRQTDPRDQPLG